MNEDTAVPLPVLDQYCAVCTVAHPMSDSPVTCKAIAFSAQAAAIRRAWFTDNYVQHRFWTEYLGTIHSFVHEVLGHALYNNDMQSPRSLGPPLPPLLSNTRDNMEKAMTIADDKARTFKTLAEQAHNHDLALQDPVLLADLADQTLLVHRRLAQDFRRVFYTEIPLKEQAARRHSSQLP